MKMNKLVKRTFFPVNFASAIFLFTSCGSDQKIVDSNAASQQHNTVKMDDKNHEDDADFLIIAAEINLEGIQLGQLAQEKGTVSHVKELGKMMEDAHTKSQKDLIALAKSKNIRIPTSSNQEAQDKYNKLNKNSGKDFDKAYADMMISCHENTIATYEKAAIDTNDVDVRNWATATLVDLRKHLEHSEACRKKSEKA